MIPLREANLRIVVLLAVFVLSAVLAAIRTAPARGTDELAHVSYVAQLQKADAPHDLANLKLLDPNSFRFRPVANYINHPPIYYAALAHLGPQLEGHPEALLWFRFINIVLAAAGLLTCFLLLPRETERLPFYAYAVPLLCIPVLIPLAGCVNNDNAAFLGGAVMLLGLKRLIETRRTGWLVLALCGLVLASWAKLTGFLLCAGVFATVFVWLLRERRLPALWSVAAVVALVIAAIPYAQLMLAYGSPAPDTPAQHAALVAIARYAGWDGATRLSFPVYAIRFVSDFVAGWQPPRGAIQSAALVFPVFAIGVAAAGVWLAARRFASRMASSDEVLVVACAVAFVSMFAVHVWFSYQRHLSTGWMMDAYPRYYFPIAPFVPLAGLVAARAWSKHRDGLLTGLAVAPVLLLLASAL
jgi:hypothetical protein